jgi:isochorismate synthase
MRNNSSVSAILDCMIKNQIAFACWFSPKDDRLGIVVGNPSDVVILEEFNQLNSEAGFVFVPYRISEKYPVILLKPNIFLDNFESPDQLDYSQIQPFKTLTDTTESATGISKEEYLELIQETIQTISDTDLAKVIISRQIPVKRTFESIGETFLRLNEQTPNAFTYLVNLPVAGVWMGATPEILLKSEGSQFEAVSLAGTQVRKYDNQEYFWSTKDIEEQAFVSRYMLDVLFDFDIHQYKTSGPETMESGRVAHLKTSFFFPAVKIENCLGNFVAELHPTPAVCGLPKDLADQWILNSEKHDRKYYTGYLGPWKLNHQLNLFVNLRCMEVNGDELILYAGGGITAHSIPEKEWDETNQKAATLLAVINNESE